MDHWTVIARLLSGHSRMIVRLLILLVLSSDALQAAELEYTDDPSKWQEEACPPRAQVAEREVWLSAANWCKIEWRITVEQGHVRAVRIGPRDKERIGPRPEFQVESGWKFRRGLRFARVDDGWLVGRNWGEWGGHLYWYSSDGTQRYKISSHQVVDFVATQKGILATEGLAHLYSDEGTLIRISRLGGDKQWKATTLTKLASAPRTACLRRDGVLLITLSNSLVAVVPSEHPKVDTLLADTDWGNLYPNSSALSADERKLYIGMRQFVGEFDLQSKQFRFLIPDRRFLNKLPKEDEDSIRQEVGGKRG